MSQSPAYRAESPGSAVVSAFHPGWLAASRWIIQAEGGYVLDHLDRGGETNYGITLPTLRTAQARGLVRADATVASLTKPEALLIYEGLYWREAHCSLLPAALGLVTFDAAVHSGVRNAVLFLQQACGVAGDGIFGPRTAAACSVRGEDLRLMLTEALSRRAVFLADLVQRDAGQRRFLRGWLLRLFRLEALGLQLVEGV